MYTTLDFLNQPSHCISGSFGESVVGLRKTLGFAAQIESCDSVRHTALPKYGRCEV